MAEVKAEAGREEAAGWAAPGTAAAAGRAMEGVGWAGGEREAGTAAVAEGRRLAACR